MSVLVVPNIGKQNMMKTVSGFWTNIPTTIHLYKNNLTPGPATVIGDFQEADFSNYSNKPTNNPVITFPDGDNRAVSTWDSQTFLKNGATGNTIFGYYVLDNGQNLLWAEKFDASIAMTVDGAFITLTPKLTGKSQFSNV